MTYYEYMQRRATTRLTRVVVPTRDPTVTELAVVIRESLDARKCGLCDRHGCGGDCYVVE